MNSQASEVANSEIHIEFEKTKYNLFHIYKWATVLFQMAVVYELIIVPMFWFVIFPGIVKYNIAQDDDDISIDDDQ